MFNIKNDEEPAPERTAGMPNVPLMWMHLTWLPVFAPLVPFIIWRIIRKKNPQAGTHFRNILNASFTFILFHVLSIFTGVGILFFLVSFGFIEGTVWLTTFEEHGHAGGYVYTPNPTPMMLIFVVYMIAFVCVIVSIRSVSIAAREGKVLPYWWAIRFFKAR